MIDKVSIPSKLDVPSWDIIKEASDAEIQWLVKQVPSITSLKIHGGESFGSRGICCTLVHF